MLTEEQLAENRRVRRIATANARAVLKPGDRLYVARCGGIRTTITMTGWDRDWITCRTADDIAAVNVLRVNGKPVDFTKEQLSVDQRPAITPDNFDAVLASVLADMNADDAQTDVPTKEDDSF